MFENMIQQLADFFMAHKGIALIVNFLVKHADFIFGVIINIILIYVFCKIADKFNTKLEKNLLKKVKNIYKQTNLNMFLLKENKTIYSSKKEKLLKEKQDNGYKYKTKNPYIYCEIKLNNYTKYELLITYENKEEENLASLICEILS